MKLLFLIIFSMSAFSNCLESYEEDYKSKMTKYNSKLKRYKKNRGNSLFSSNIIIASIGASLEPPTKEHIFEESVLKSAGIGASYNTDAVMQIYYKLKPIHAFIKPEVVQAEFKKGLENGDFCKGIFGKYRIERAKRYVLKSLKSKRDIAIVEDSSINDEEGSKSLNESSIRIPSVRVQQK